ncbi:peptidoglycan hydrolase [Aliidiomarina sedimenti]|uniref:Peptidoglycan hydrolase n=1 Tax=Aliidiomarina sedimenti TaxID=1933879 RepID=A0ABY0C2U8_9GAMM|nr:glucosaminidase domain-containing protein [Aliidiomarina sedimenti]RUO31765.1 peptidoglycan hydrolase [Aliidiomarina sedimenti]
MKWFVRSAAALIVAAAIAVPFVQHSGRDAQQDDTAGSPSQIERQSQPPIDQPLSQQTDFVPAFADIYDVTERKREFFAYLLPAIDEVNQRITEQRAYLNQLQNKVEQGESLNQREQRWIEAIVSYYRVDEEQLQEQLAVLNRRVDIVPGTLVLIQAANESGWGTSRFATEGLNFFGQWCWTDGCGIVPGSRPDGERYEVRRFDSMEASVESFIRNLNTHFAYAELRQMRLEEREQEDSVSSTTLTAGLMSYSERGQDYIDELNQMIRINRPIIEDVRDEGLQVEAEGTATVDS